jgi:CAI-1 autoinducer synthase
MQLMAVPQLTSPPRTEPTTRAALPPRIQARVDRFYRDRFDRDWGGQHILRGRTPGPGDILLNSNDYLAIGGHPRITEAMAASLRAVGNGQLASGTLLHGDHPQLRLERELARHVGMPAGILCQSGWDANAGLLQSIADDHTPVYIDMLAHMSLWYGASVARAITVPFRHNDLARLHAAIQRNGPGIIAVDALYSTNGSIAPLDALADLAEQTESVLVVDESHSLGAVGRTGEGLVAASGLTGRVHFVVASLSKAFAGRAGFIGCATEDFPDYFKLESLPAVFSSTMLPHDVAGLTAALHIVTAESWRRDRLATLAGWLRAGIQDLGFDLDGSASHIIAIPAGAESHCIEIRDALEARGVFGSVFCPPATSRNRTVVRFSVHAALSDSQAEQVVTACRDLRELTPPRKV